MFEQKGVIVLKGEIGEEALLEISLEGGADSYELIDDADFQGAEVLTEVTNLENLNRTFQETGFTVRDASLRWLPNTTIEVSNSEQMRSLIKTIDTLESLDDVQNVTANWEITAELITASLTN
jgi:transcriptional/translational regulatory protein YebC/TACO1